MAQSKHEYFHFGVTNQKRPDIVVDLKRPDRSKMKQWTDEHRRGLMDFLDYCEKEFMAFKQEIIEANNL